MNMRDERMAHGDSRRQFLKYAGTVSSLSIAGLAGCTGGGDGSSDDFPNEDLRYIIPFSEGGGTDTFARQVIPVMGDELGQSIAIENVPGAASLRGTGDIYYADPDGYTFGGFNPPSTPVSAMVNPPDYEMEELKGVGTYARTPFVIVANPEHEIEDFEDLKSRYESGELETFSGKERGGVDHVLAILMRDNQEYDFGWGQYVGYDGSGPAVQATVSGEVPAAISTDTAAEGAASDGRVDPVVSLSSEGTGVFPELETVVDVGYPNIDYLGQLVRGMYAPPETPDENIQVLTDALEAALQTDEVQQWAEEAGYVIEYGEPESAEAAVQDAFDNIPDEVDLDEVREATN